jgi:hypothetical protein
LVRSASWPDEVVLMGQRRAAGAPPAPRPVLSGAWGAPAAERRSPCGAVRAVKPAPQAQTRTDPDSPPGCPQQPYGDTPPDPRRTVGRGGTALAGKPGEPTCAQRLAESVRFLENAVDKPVGIDPGVLAGATPNVKGAYLAPAGTIMAEDRDGWTSTLSLMVLPTDQAPDIPSQVMRTLGGKGGEPK